MNSVGNKFEPLKEKIKDNIDILLVSELKLDDTFLVGQFAMMAVQLLTAFTELLYGGRILLYIREDILSTTSTMIKFKPVQKSFEGFFVEINLRKKTWLFSCSYNSNRNNVVNHMKNINTGIDQFSTTCDNVILLGDFNDEPEEDNISNFLNIYNLKHLVKQKKYYKNPDNPSRIDSILTNWHRSFQNTTVFETGLSNSIK